ncbi:MAG TPA: helix-turn-helix transcriptional regulator [Gammaproteobacteria bacterium]|nr:helix-turn-helix transcriptional regulator [Gammaproteobacteria bacterium]
MKKLTLDFSVFHIFTLLAVILFFAIDVIEGYASGHHNGIHFYFELFFVIALTYLLITQLRKINLTTGELTATKDKLSVIEEGPHEEIDKQFSLWKLTKAETDVAWFVIKGISFPKIAELRNVSEKTIHQQISSVYKKSNTKNRHEFMSGFLEDFINR